MDMHRAFRVAENLYADEALNGIEYVGIGYDYEADKGTGGGYRVELFTDMSDDHNEPYFTIRSEGDLEKFWKHVNAEIGADCLADVAPN